MFRGTDIMSSQNSCPVFTLAWLPYLFAFSLPVAKENQLTFKCCHCSVSGKIRASLQSCCVILVSYIVVILYSQLAS